MIIRLHWWKEFRADKLQNYGDLMSKYLVEKFSKKKVFATRDPLNKILKKIIKPYYIVIGSVIGAANKNAIVWGSGIITKNQDVGKATFLAVRGPKTRKRLITLGYNVPEVYGDPAILLPNFIKSKGVKKYDIGIIPHFVDYNLVFKLFQNNPQIKVINLLTNSVEKTTEQILECKQIISSSLHGVIVGHAYRISSIWVKFLDNLSGDDVKFYDYFESMNINYKKVISIHPKALNEEKINTLFSNNKAILLPEIEMFQTRQKELLNSCPF
ncbi:hypothetical protein A8C32_00790 [Flavivirga aquatica]|uniref:Polysaccharide pyruvyl transferase domain-containing protein n=1 Tax=Flavivirga aquatica TaxID=1849968 RepID=A0A1E5TBU3_9FLAO|nr:polysaccharide pyruvyl transferase family protein [Flavivirga aquatica]OEK08845.1 hypothetical protein A8C32_00790 [Flavivirga aquatica]